MVAGAHHDAGGAPRCGRRKDRRHHRHGPLDCAPVLESETPVPIDPADTNRKLHPPTEPVRGWTFAAGETARSGIGAHVLPIPLPWLDGTRRDETWFEGCAIAHAAEGALSLLATDDVLCGLLDVSERISLEATIAAAYRAVEEACTGRGFPHLLRVWNFFGAINAGAGDEERYRRFCVGRAEVLRSRPSGGYPAATAIGIPGPSGRVQVAFLAGRRAGSAIENPRQTSAWQYPRQFGPVAPGFARAMLLAWLPEPLLLVSGTASVVGHASVHASTGDQLDEALRNIDMVIATAATQLNRPLALGRGGALRVYLRDAGEACAVATQLRERLPPDVDWMLLHGDICRSDLRIELELRQRCTTA